MLNNRKLIITLSLVLILVGCGSKNSTKTTSTTSQNTDNKTQSASSTAKSSDDNASGTATTSDKESEQSSTSTSTSSSTSQNSEGQTLLKKLYETSKTGNIPNCNFNSNGTLIQTVEKTWGKPDKTNIVGKDTYYIYNKYGVVFGVRKDSKIFDIRSYGKNFDEVRYDDVEKTLGKPAQISHYKGEDTIIYNVNKNFELMFIFYEPDSNNPNPTLQYISVTCSKVI